MYVKNSDLSQIQCFITIELQYPSVAVPGALWWKNFFGYITLDHYFLGKYKLDYVIDLTLPMDDPDYFFWQASREEAVASTTRSARPTSPGISASVSCRGMTSTATSGFNFAMDSAAEAALL